MNSWMLRHRLGILLFLLLFAGNSLWLYSTRSIPITDDDIWGATAVLGTPIEVVIFTLRWDLHPPLYYLLLDCWAIFGKSDLWLSMSSCFIHALISTVAFNYVYRRHGIFAALCTTALVFFSPLLLEQSVKIRMYPFLALLSLCIFYLIEKYKEADKKSLLVSIAALGVALIYSHAIGVILLFFHFCYGFLSLQARQRRVWIVMHMLVALTALPVIANSMIRKLGHALTPAAAQIWQLFQDLLVGTANGHSAATQQLGATSSSTNLLEFVIALLLVLQCLLMLYASRDKTTRNILLCYLVLPVLVFVLLSYTVKPLWLERNFIFALPILSIMFGISLAKMPTPNWLKLTLVFAIVGINLSQSAMQNRRHPTENSFAQVIEFLQNESQTKAKICVVAPNHVSTFWSLQRYLMHTEWGNPTDIQPPLGERWLQIREQLPESLVKLLKLRAQSHFSESTDLVIASTTVERCQQADITSRYLVIETRPFDTLNPAYPLIFANDHYQIFGQDKNQ